MKTNILLPLCLLAAASATGKNLVPEHIASTPDRLNEKETKHSISQAEAYIRSGIILLGRLHDTLSQVRTPESAEQAVAPVVRLMRDFKDWGQSSTALPAMDEAIRQTYEQKYLPIINMLNERIRIQAERVAAAEYYGSRNLPAALVQLAQLYQP